MAASLPHSSPAHLPPRLVLHAVVVRVQFGGAILVIRMLGTKCVPGRVLFRGGLQGIVNDELRCV